MDRTATVPDEVLRAVFSFVQAVDPIQSILDYRPRRSSPYTKTPSVPHVHSKFGWINVTYVDRRWRRVAIDHAVLWTKLDGSLGTVWLHEFIKRSREAPLSINNYDVSSFTNTPTAKLRQDIAPILGDLLLTDYARLSSLFLFAPTIGFHRDAFTRNFDALEDITVEDIFSAMPASYPLHLLLDCAPRLHRLRFFLPNCDFTTFDWTHKNLSNIGSLDMTMAERFQIPDFLTALQRLNSLSHLTLTHYVQRRCPLSCEACSTARCEDRVRVPSLKTMMLELSSEMLVHLLRHIRLPSDTRLSLASFGPSKDESVNYALSRELSQLSRSRQETSPPQFAFVDFQPTGANDMTIELSQIADYHRIFPRNRRRKPVHDAQLTLYYPLERGDILLPSLGLSFAHTLSVVDAGTAVNGAILQFTCFPNVARLRLSGTARQGGAIYHGLEVLKDAAVLSELRFLDMDATVFDLRMVLYGINCASGWRDGLVSTFEKVLQARKTAGKPLQALYVHVEEEIALVEQGNVNGTSCMYWPMRKVLEAVECLKAVEGLIIVRKDYDPFSSWPSAC
ncbi:unnamed protein product [Peniophora sp. CBMAI 1063]|nr:unnamed protein product [Peniophora sp. CBMAI 1063]